MKTIALATVFLASMSALAPAQDLSVDRPWEPVSFSTLRSSPAPDPEPNPLPGSLSADSPMDELPASFSLGPAGGYLRARGADRGTWFGGAQARVHFAGFLAAEASVTFHQNRYQNDDVVVTQYPVQLTAFLYIFPEGPIRPYILGGVGWYYSRIQYSGLFSSIHDRTENIFGEHLGAGGELMLSSRTSADVDARYIFLNPTNDQVIHRDYNYWQITFGVNLYF